MESFKNITVKLKRVSLEIPKEFGFENVMFALFMYFLLLVKYYAYVSLS